MSNKEAPKLSEVLINLKIRLKSIDAALTGSQYGYVNFGDTTKWTRVSRLEAARTLLGGWLSDGGWPLVREYGTTIVGQALEGKVIDRVVLKPEDSLPTDPLLMIQHPDFSKQEPDRHFTATLDTLGALVPLLEFQVQTTPASTIDVNS